MKTTRREALKRAASVLLAAVVASPAAARPKPVLRCTLDNCPVCLGVRGLDYPVQEDMLEAMLVELKRS